MQVPALLPVTTPFATVTKPVGEAPHVTVLLVAFAGSTVAVMVLLSPSFRVRVLLLRLTLCTGISCTLPSHSARSAFRAACASLVL